MQKRQRVCEMSVWNISFTGIVFAVLAFLAYSSLSHARAACIAPKDAEIKNASVYAIGELFTHPDGKTEHLITFRVYYVPGQSYGVMQSFVDGCLPDNKNVILPLKETLKFFSFGKPS